MGELQTGLLDERAGTARPGRTGKRPTVGVLLDWLKDSYQNAVVAGLADAAQARDVNLVVFAGGVLGAPAGDGLHRNFVFDLCGPRNVDGVVVLAGALANHLGPEAVEALVKRWAPMPLASVALSLPGIPSLLLDEGPGMRQALEHLVSRHGCRRVAFIRGPSVNAEAERRYRLYQAVLAEHGLPHDPALICEGTFHKSSGAAAVRTLVDERKVDFDAVVASNDYMALAAIAALEQRGLAVPSDVAVIGFDDLEDARFSTPPLTTVRQPLHQQGEAALDLVLAQIEGGRAPAETVSASELVTRQSCGCFSGLARPGRAGPVTPTQTPIDNLLTEHSDALLEQMSQSVHGAAASLPLGWDRQLLDAFQVDLRGGGAGLFAGILDRLLTDVVNAGDDVASWQGLVSALRKLLLPALTNSPLRWVQAEDLWHEARILIAEQTERAQARHRLDRDRMTRILAESSAALMSTQQLPSLLRAIAEQLPRLGIPAGWLALFEPPPVDDDGADADPASATSRLALAFDETGETPAIPPHPTTPALGASWPAFPRTDLLPPDVESTRRSALVVEPLFFHAVELGYLVLEMGPREGILYESLGEQISGAIEEARLVERLLEEALLRATAERKQGTLETEIVARIRTAHLARELAAPGLEIAAGLLPGTAEGGADGYDLVALEDGCWIGVVQVAGHGLGAGLSSLMLQSGVGALIHKLPDIAPRELAAAAAASLRDRVRESPASDHPAALSLLRYRRDGSVTFAGRPDQLLICRAASGRCEPIAAPAKRAAPSDGIAEHEARLESGDLLVLYNDGAVQEGGLDRRRFGVERLAAAVESNRQAPVAAVRDAAIESARAFSTTPAEDVIVVVARYRGG